MAVLPLHRLNNISGLNARNSIWGVYKTQPRFSIFLKHKLPISFRSCYYSSEIELNKVTMFGTVS